MAQIFFFLDVLINFEDINFDEHYSVMVNYSQSIYYPMCCSHNNWPEDWKVRLTVRLVEAVAFKAPINIIDDYKDAIENGIFSNTI